MPFLIKYPKLYIKEFISNKYLQFYMGCSEVHQNHVYYIVKKKKKVSLGCECDINGQIYIIIIKKKKEEKRRRHQWTKIESVRLFES